MTIDDLILEWQTIFQASAKWYIERHGLDYGQFYPYM